MVLALPNEIEALVRQRVAETGHRDANAYLIDLVTADARDSADPVLEAALLDGDAGPDEPWDIASIRARAKTALTTGGTRD